MSAGCDSVRTRLRYGPNNLPALGGIVIGTVVRWKLELLDGQTRVVPVTLSQDDARRGLQYSRKADRRYQTGHLHACERLPTNKCRNIFDRMTLPSAQSMPHHFHEFRT